MTSFSKTELTTLHNTKFFEVKAAATKKIDQLLANVRDELKEEIQKRKFSFPPEVDSINGKIFRGENYKGLPYLVLDYPKHFSRDSVFAFRTMFWWGNFFSLTVHLQGRTLQEYRLRILEMLPLLKGKNIFICVNVSPWQYYYEKDNYILIDKLTGSQLKKIILEKDFIKLSRKIPLKDYPSLSEFCRESFAYLCPA